jgi:hypothetical protein
MTISQSEEKEIVIPFEGFMVHIVYPENYIHGKPSYFYVETGNGSGENVAVDSLALDDLFLELKTRADWGKESKRAAEYHMPSVITQIGKGTDKPVPSDIALSTVLMTDYFKEQLGGPLGFPELIEKEPKAYPEVHRAAGQVWGKTEFSAVAEKENDKSVFSSNGNKLKLITTGLEELGKDVGGGIPYGQMFIFQGKGLYVKTKSCEVCDGTGYSKPALALLKVIQQEIQYNLSQREVDALVSADCLKSMTHYLSEGEWFLKSNAKTPTALEVMVLARKDEMFLDSHAINVIVKTRLKMFHVRAECSTCNGVGKTHY